ncbi:MAG: TraB/GumN family protein [Acetobacteraceae bacterium]|nr:TraB/GumN family protein [Acetobacteraceae bacterium]
MRILLATCRAFGFALLLVASRAAADQGVPAFEITTPQGSSSILLGTMHLGDPRIVQPSATLLDGASRLVVETERGEPPARSPIGGLWPGAMADFVSTGHLRRAPWVGELTAQQIASLRDRIVCKLPDGQADLTAQAVELTLAMRPMMAAFAAAYPCANNRLKSRDELLADAARNRQVPIVGLESQTENENQLESIPDSVWVENIRHSLPPEGDEHITSYIAALNAGDFDRIHQISVQFFDDPTHAQVLEDQIVAGRNRAWMPRLENY